MPSPVELIQLKIQYHRKVGTLRASKRIELGATVPAPGSTSSASTFLSVTPRRLAARVLSRGRGRALACRSAPHHLVPLVADAGGQRLARNPLPRATRAAVRASRVTRCHAP